MLALLLAEGLSVEKVTDKGQLVKLRVDENQLSSAIEILSRNSYPRDQFATLQDIFPEGGLISTPVEERARYNFAVSQDLAATVSNIDGVLTARVHLVLPDNESTNDRGSKQIVRDSKASVFIKHSSDIPLDSYIPQIKQMVANSVDGLKYENIAVLLFPSVATFKPIEIASATQRIETLRELSDWAPWIFMTLIVILLAANARTLVNFTKSLISENGEG